MGVSTRTGDFYSSEVLKYTTGRELKKSYVLDAANISILPDDTNRYIVPGGTVLKLNATGDGVVPYNGSGTIVGILDKYAELTTSLSSDGDTAVAVFSHWAIFATTAIIGFTNYAAQLVTQLPHCDFE